MIRSALSVATVCLSLQACGLLLWEHVHPVPVPEIDRLGVDLARARALPKLAPAESVVALLGKPADKRESLPNRIEWRYPIRAWNDMANNPKIVPAVLLRIRFDARGIVKDWTFVDPRFGRPVAIHETLDEASRWFESLANAPSPTPPRIELAKVLIRDYSTQSEVERVLGQWKPWCTGCLPLPVVRKTRAEAGDVWDWYVDRPSPLFIPPMYLIASFDHDDRLIVWYLRTTYPGGRE